MGVRVGVGNAPGLRVLRREVRAVARIAHPNVIPLYERGEQSGKPFLVFEYVEGAPLRDELVRLRPLEPVLPVSLYLLSAHTAPLSQAARKLVKHLGEAAEAVLQTLADTGAPVAPAAAPAAARAA